MYNFIRVLLGVVVGLALSIFVNVYTKPTAPPPPTYTQVPMTQIDTEIWRFEDQGATCWKLDVHNGGGISCIPTKDLAND